VDAQTKLAVSLVIGPRSQTNAEALWGDFAQRTDHVVPELITTDEYRVYAGAILRTYGRPQAWPRTGKPGRPRQPRLVPPRDLVYAMVHKLRRKGRVVQVTIRRVFGAARQVAKALARSGVSTQVNTSFVERFNATVRQHNSRKARKVYTFSKDIAQHHAMSWFALAYYNFCRPHLGLRRQEAGSWRGRTPAMAAGLSHHVWSLHEFMCYPLAHIPL
jgi:IS1 family transposase